MSTIPLDSFTRADVRSRHRSEREDRNARVQAGLCPGLSPVRTLADMSPEERARVVAEIEAAHAPKPRPAAVAAPRPITRAPEPLPVTAEERAQEAEERAAVQAAPEPEPIPADEAQETTMTTIESARNLRAELDNIAQMQAEKRRAALTLADELEQEARSLREAAGGVALAVRTETPPKAMSRPLVPATKPKRTEGRQPHFGTIRPGTLSERIVSLLADRTVRSPGEIVSDLGEHDRRLSVYAACTQLAKRGHILRVGKGRYGRAAA